MRHALGTNTAQTVTLPTKCGSEVMVSPVHGPRHVRASSWHSGTASAGRTSPVPTTDARVSSAWGAAGAEVVRTPDGRRLQTRVQGDGEDLVVLEAGLGLSGAYWGLVQNLVGTRAKVVAYDRAGFGASSPDGGARTLARIVSDLEVVIRAYPHRRLALVGHSWGGPIVRALAARRLGQHLPLVGLVLVDQSDENSSVYFDPSTRRQFSVQARFMVPLARLKILTPIYRGLVRGLADPLKRAVVASSTSVNAARATSAELLHVVEGLRGLKEGSSGLGDLAVRVISGQKTTTRAAKARASIMQAHRKTADQHPGARLVRAQHSGHMIPITEPELIAAEVLALFDRSAFAETELP